MGALKEYDPKQVVVSWDGVTLNEGIADGTFVSVTRTERVFALSVGGDGGTTRVRQNNQSGTVTVTLRAGSATNELLSVKVQDEETGTSHVGPLLVKDFSGNTLHESEQAFLEGFPDDAMATEEGTREWVLLCPVLRMFPAGNKDA